MQVRKINTGSPVFFVLFLTSACLQMNHREATLAKPLSLTSLSVLHLALVPLHLGQDAGGGRVPLQLVQAAVRRDAAKNWSALQVSCERAAEQTSETGATTDRAGRDTRSSCGPPGLHLRVRMVWILVFFPTQELPSVYTSRMSFPGRV